MSKPFSVSRRALIGKLAAAAGAQATFPSIVSSSVPGRGGAVASLVRSG